ncbi:MAG: DUF4397 domain-containing protein [Ginsengibacter sp.]
MKYFFAKHNLRAFIAVLSLSVVFAACNKHKDITRTPAAGLMTFNLAPDQDAIGVKLDGNNLTAAPLAYTNFSGVYNSVYTGNRVVTTFAYFSGTTLLSTNQTFDDSTYYSMFFVGSNGNYNNLIVKDNLDSLPSGTGQAFIRYINAIPDSVRQPMVDVTSTGNDVFNTAAPFKTVSNFKGVSPGTIAISVVSDTAINATRDITVEQGKVYTILLVGMPNATDAAQQVAIKFIQNGTIQ